MDVSAVSSTVLSNVALQKPHECACDDKEVSAGREVRQDISQGAAIQAFRAELRTSLKAQFHADYNSNQSAYAANQESASPDDVADEALAVARNVAKQSPESVAKAMIRFRSSVSESVQVASKYTQTEADQSDLNMTTAKIEEGVSKIEDDAAKSVVSSASALSVDTSTRQRSTIKIRTQEGDLVRLSLRQATEFSASSAEVADGNGVAQSTEIDFSSKSRMYAVVRGDLNEAEMGAIESVLAQAQEMADAFFGGDIGAAFASAGGFEFDTEQLSRVKMRFKMRQETNVAYSEVRNSVTMPPEVEEPKSAPAVAASAPVAPAAPEVVESAEPVEAVAPVVEKPEAPVVADDAMQGFFELVGSFLRSVSEGFVEGMGSASVRYHYSESFKLSLLQSVINTVAPDDAGDASDAAVQLIDQISETE